MTSPTPRPRPKQLALEWTQVMRWADLPATVQAQLRTELSALLHQAAARRPTREEAADDDV
jgi:hypothetical protein